jgi:hypothetical protein
MNARALTLLCLFPVALSAQSNYFGNAPIWRVSSTTMGFTIANCLSTDTYNYYLKGDTAIGSAVYQKVLKKGFGYFTYYGSPTPAACSGTWSYNDSTHWTALVRDTLKRIYILRVGDVHENLLFDFNLHVGDTLPLTANNTNPNLYVKSIDSLLVAGKYRKQFHTTGPTLIESIGSNYGFFEHMGPNSDGSTHLNCYSLNDTAYYPSMGSTCSIALGVQEKSSIQDLILLFPNPAGDVVHMHTEEDFAKSPVELLDFKGRVIRNWTITSADTDIQLEGLASGLYFLKIMHDERVLIRKFVKLLK